MKGRPVWGPKRIQRLNLFSNRMCMERQTLSIFSQQYLRYITAGKHALVFLDIHLSLAKMA